VTDGLEDLFRHNTWANLQLIDVCSPLTSDQLGVSVDGTYGSIRRTLVHLVAAEEGYLWRLTGERPREDMSEDDWPGFEELRERAAESGDRLEVEGARTDVDRVVEWIGGDGMHRATRAALLLTQSINHSTEHRSQVMTVLTQVGVEPPELDGWAYMLASGQLSENEP
jgi:uncharacterized damage-inducible protein DinB